MSVQQCHETLAVSFEDLVFDDDRTGRIGLITLDRPEALNALSATMRDELVPLVRTWDADPTIRAIVLTGSDKAFAAGADIRDMVDVTHLDALESDFLEDWNAIARCRTPTIAAVAGHALGGGCEIAMMCDILLAADNARFGQPEIRLGTIPGLGGTQRLTRLIGRAKAMELCLTGRVMEAVEAERAGLVSRIVPLGDLRDEALATARLVAGFSRTAVLLAKECVQAAANTTLEQGLLTERRAFHSLFGSDDQREGMQAFLEKRAPRFTR